MESQQHRATEGTAHALQAGVKIGGEFAVCPNGSAEFLKFRASFFEELYNKQKKHIAGLDHHEISLTLPDGKQLSGTSNQTTPMDVCKQISQGLAKETVVAKVVLQDTSSIVDSIVDVEDENTCCNSEKTISPSSEMLWDMNRPLPCSCSIKFLRFDDEAAKTVFWHSSAHVLGETLEQLFGCYLTIGPALTRGFYYDFYAGDQVKISQDMYSAIETKFRELAKQHQPFQRLVMKKADALEMFKHNPFKVALISAKVPDNGLTSCYKSGQFVDLCMGPHLPSTGALKAFSVEKHSATNWLGNTSGDSLQRVYGISFPENKMLTDYKRIQEEARKKDHRILGNTLDLFFFDAQASPGCAFWLKEGAIVYNKLCDFMRKQYRFWGFQEVMSPNMFDCDIFKTSGHYQNYQDCMFVMNVEKKEWALKPMNCPGHCMIFRHMNPSYKQLPLRLADFGVLHRNELSGSLTGLTRVRRFCQDDAHIFCRLNQITEEVNSAIQFLVFVYGCFGFSFRFKLSTRPEHFLGEIPLWDAAEKQLEQALNRSSLPWELNPGDGAFYGPKIDVEIRDALERWHQCGTIQLDFQQPLRFDLKYRTEELTVGEGELPAKETEDSVTESGVTESAVSESAVTTSNAPEPAPAGPKRNADWSWEQPLKPGYARPVMIHRAILGSIERMSAILLEHTGGRLPFHISPRQAIVCPISEKFLGYAKYVEKILNAHEFDVKTDDSNNTIKKKIRDASQQQWNYILVVGQKEQDNLTIMMRPRETPDNQEVVTIQQLIDKFKLENDVGGIKLRQTFEPFVANVDNASTAAE